MIRKSILRRFWACTDGVAAIEFALTAPLLVLTLAVSVEIGRAYLAYRCFDNALGGLARDLASFPEYDSTARTQAPLVAAMLLPSDGLANFNLQVTSLKMDQNVMTTVFTHTLLGSNPNLPVSATVSATQFVQNETVIYLAASYDYRPLFNMLPSSAFRFTKSFTIGPYFSRNYVWNSSKSPDKYVQ